MKRSDVLKQVQQHGRQPDTDRNNLLQDIILNARLLQHRDELSDACLGALLYSVWRLYGSFAPPQRPEQLAETYASVELTSFAQSEEEIERIRVWGHLNGVVFRFLPVDCVDNGRRWIIVSHGSQTTYDGQSWEAGEVVANPLRQAPTVRELLRQLGEG